ncbi:MAG: hypothetical protein AB7N80_06705 [Bdellovibrionales bacterium]
MSKFKMSMLAGLALVATVTSAAVSKFSLEDVNAQVAELLVPLNNDKTTVRITFTDLLVDEVKAQKFGLNALLSKVGEQNKLEFLLDKVEYVNDGQNPPQVDAAVRMKLDLVKAFSQKWIDETAPEAAELLADISKSYIEQYGEAVTIDAKIDELLKDEQEHVTSLRLHFDVSVDMSKLPTEVKPEDVYFSRLRVNANVSRVDMGASVTVQMNPEYMGFKENQLGLKELIEALLNKDQETYEGFMSIAKSIDQMADWLVNKKPDED